MLDTYTLCFTLALSLTTAFVFGVIPAAQSSCPDLIEALKENTRGSTAGLRRHRLRDGLVVLEIAIAMVLLIGAGLMLNSFLRLYSAPTGCDTRNVLTFQVRLPSGPFVNKSGVGPANSMVAHVCPSFSSRLGSASRASGGSSPPQEPFILR